MLRGFEKFHKHQKSEEQLLIVVVLVVQDGVVLHSFSRRERRQ